jgi:hypothetical protein
MSAPQNISLTLPFSQAMQRVKVVLFQPFDAGKWFVIGFCAWLALLGEGGFHGGSGYNFGQGPGGGGRNLSAAFEQARDYVMNNLGWILPLAATLVVVGLAVWVVILWVSSRGQFMFLHCVTLNKAEVRAPWSKYRREANSLFRFRLVLALSWMALTLPLVAGAVILVVRMVQRGQASVGGVLGAVGCALATVALAIFLGVVAKLTKDFVVPIQLVRGGTCREGWRILLGLLSADVGSFILYFLFQIVLAMGILFCVAVIVLATCCIAGCFLLIPYLGTVLLLPVLMFKRAYSAYYLAQYGPGFDVFAPAVAPA